MTGKSVITTDKQNNKKIKSLVDNRSKIGNVILHV